MVGGYLFKLVIMVAKKKEKGARICVHSLLSQYTKIQQSFIVVKVTALASQPTLSKHLNFSFF